MIEKTAKAWKGGNISHNPGKEPLIYVHNIQVKTDEAKDIDYHIKMLYSLEIA